MHANDTDLHAQGASTFIDDMPEPAGLLHACPVVSGIAHGLIESIDLNDALACPGVVAILLARDIPGCNNIGNVEAEEVLLAEQEVTYQGQPVAVVVAESDVIARQAADLVRISYNELPAVFDARTAHAQGLHIAPPRIFSLGDVDQAWRDCDVIVEGSAVSGAQEHVYLETQVAVAYPLENNGLKVFSATQSPGMVQRVIARVLDCAMNRVEVDVLRLGGGFGGKEEQATGWAAMAALAASRLQKPVKIRLNRGEDMRWTGKRHPYDSDFKIGLDQSGRILAYEVCFYQNAGAVADLSLAILERTLFHAGNSYFIPNVRATAISCRTHLTPNTAFRGFGGPQAMFALEAAIFKAAAAMNVDPAHIQRRNLLQEGQPFPYGMPAENCRAQRCWQQLHDRFGLPRRQQAIDNFNAGHSLEKKALALMPICFGISFTATFLNQASALVHVYADGSVSVSCGAVEMGQGVKEKIRQVAARALAIDKARVKVESTNTARIANMSPTAASVGADLNGQATLLACQRILQGLKTVAARLAGGEPEQISIEQEIVCLDGRPTATGWNKLVSEAYLSRTPLSAHAHYATPKVFFDRSTERGRPFAYHVYGCAAVEVTVDCLRGTYRVTDVSIVHDGGRSLAPEVDRGQVEGGVVQGLGWMTLEEVLHDGQGRLLTDSLTAYKIPDIHSAPDISVEFLDGDNPAAVMHSKAVGEPPLMYGIGGYFALVKAIRAFNPDWQPGFSAPMTPEKVLLALYECGC
ncbi:MAG: molybdopterin-dependent oxidoreductase [Methylobacter sp.]|uniref:xanthine dehydrogenase molybdopterin binding subunit n=1 Tax=Methylobacter sp. TaxID=2051955 RepID=UPI0025856C50|nr:molybdopterin cofactor-binding domain-containing protein [Methylobacter sp.]MCL7421887.1 molybdopterin-dependent oxidoreductase [Methylobacter sp.]